MPHIDSAREAARTLLGTTHRVRTPEQLDKVLADLLAFIASQRTILEEQYRHARSEGILAHPPASSHVRRDAEAGEEAGLLPSASSSLAVASGHDRLLLCSMLAGAFGRRADHLITTHTQASSARVANEFDFVFDLDGRGDGGGGGSDGGAAGGDRVSRAQQRRAALQAFKSCMEQLAAALEELQAVAMTAPSPLRFSAAMSDCPGSLPSGHVRSGRGFRGGGGDAPRKASHGGSGSSAAALTYGIGEVKDFAVHQRARAMDRLRSLVGSTTPNRWSVESVVEAVWDISEFSPPTIAFGGQRRHDATSEPPSAALEATRVVTPLKDPLSRAAIRTPCRGERCVHLDVFDAANFVRAAQRRSASHPAAATEAGAPCPLCRRFVSLTTLRVDMTAVKAIAAFKEQVRAEAAQAPPSSWDSAVASAKVVTADHFLEWDMEEGTCRVVQGKQAAHHDAAVEEEEEEGNDEGRSGGDGDGNDTTRKEGGDGGIRKRRRVEIGGHVLFVDE